MVCACVCVIVCACACVCACDFVCGDEGTFDVQALEEQTHDLTSLSKSRFDQYLISILTGNLASNLTSGVDENVGPLDLTMN
jgi:hypothetical protein